METEKRKLGRKKMVKSTLNSSGSVISVPRNGERWRERRRRRRSVRKKGDVERKKGEEKKRVKGEFDC